MTIEGTTEPRPSSLPDLLDQLRFRPELEKYGPSDAEVESLLIFQRAANFLATAMIFLTKAPVDPIHGIEKKDVKKRLLGHFGTVPGLNLVTAHVNSLIRRHKQKFIVVTGPGHGAPANLATLYLEGSITRFYPKYSMDRKGLDAFVKSFSFPGGFPSHVNAETPGAIHEGGELGYALAVSYGAVMDKPDLIVACVVGDGEAETGPTATAWHAHKFIDPAESGMVIPILHVNGFKISERTLFGTMDDLEATALFTGYGYRVCIVEYDDCNNPRPEADRKMQIDMYAAMEWALSEIKAIQNDARNGKPRDKPRWPMIFMRSPKGWTGPKSLDGLPLVNSFRSHQVPLPAAATDDEQFKMLQEWLVSYDPATLFDLNGGSVIRPEVLKNLPDGDTAHLRLGLIADVWRGHQPLSLPDWKQFSPPVGQDFSEMKVAGKYLEEVIRLNPTNFRIFSPDELASNKLNSVFGVTHRNMQWDPETANSGGRVIEMLSEHTLQGFLQGYTLTGRTGLFPSYEAFLSIVVSMCEQYSKFLKISLESKWREPVSSLNYIETSTLWRQEHNGYSHQAPGFINTMLVLPPGLQRIYLPPDSACFVSCLDHCLRSKGYINLMIGAKHDTPVWLSAEEAEVHCITGGGVWPRYSTNEGKDPDVVLVGIGVEMTTEIIHAAGILKRDAPGLKIRVVNICDLLILRDSGHPHALDQTSFDSMFTKDRPVIINFHGYPDAVRSLLFARNQSLTRSRFTVLGYVEQGTTTTPFSMLRINHVGRFDVAYEAVKAVSAFDPNGVLAMNGHTLAAMYQHKNKEHERYTLEHGQDPPELSSPPLFEA